MHDFRSGFDRMRERVRKPVNWIFNDELMIVLALLLVPIVGIPLLFPLSPVMAALFSLMNNVIIAAFIMEYFLKLFVADSAREFISDKWHVLDLAIILLALAEFLPVFSLAYGEASPMLRLLRVLRIFTAAGRTADIVPRPVVTAAAPAEKEPMLIGIRDSAGTTTCSIMDHDCRIPPGSTAQWIHIQNVGDRDFGYVSTAIGVPRPVLESKLNRDAITRIDFFKNYSTIFLRDSRLTLRGESPQDLAISMDGLLVICRGQQIVTLCTGKNDLHASRGEGIDLPEGTPFTVGALYHVLYGKIRDTEAIIDAFEQKINTLEELPLEKTSPLFLGDTLHLRKELQKVIKTLWHARQVFDSMRTRKVALDGIGDEDLNLFDMLYDDAEYLYESAMNLGDNLSAIRELHINSISYNMTRVMKILAVMTALAIIPTTIGGLLGENLYDSPWQISLFEIFFIVVLLMGLTLYAFYRKGWLQ
jgi:Mg2+ and Co2+ transporter CorA